MWALEHLWIPRRASVFADTPVALVAGLGASWLAVASLVVVTDEYRGAREMLEGRHDL